jgi:hypothetical protein
VKKTALLVGPTIAVLLGAPLLKPAPAPAPVEITQPVEAKKTFTKRRPVQLREKKVERIAPGKAKLKPKKERGKSTGSPAGQPKPQNSGPDLPWPCWTVKMHAAGKSEAQLRAEGRAAGIKLSRKQEAQARACLKG